MKRHVNKLLILLILLGLVFILATNTDAGTTHTVYMPMTQRGETIPFGSAVYSGYLTNPQYEQILDLHFNTIEPEVGGTYLWVKGGDNYASHGWADMDYIMSYATNNNMRVIYHNLRWWYPNDDVSAHPQTWDEVDAWMREAMGRYPTIDNWIVVNEGYDRLGNATVPYLVESYTLADQLRPDATLWYNGLFIEPAEQVAVLSLIDRGYVEKIGIQGHFDLNTDLAMFNTFLNQLEERGVPWEITELDIIIPDPSYFTAQAMKYQDVLHWALEHHVAGISFWEFTDKYNWLSNGDLYTLYAAPFDVNILPKPAWFVLVETED